MALGGSGRMQSLRTLSNAKCARPCCPFGIASVIFSIADSSCPKQASMMASLYKSIQSRSSKRARDRFHQTDACSRSPIDSQSVARLQAG